MLAFHLDARAGVPTYLQLAQQVRHALRLGRLEVGDQLPSVRDVVAALAINPNTVMKAYRELEHEGLVASRPGQGTFVAKTPPGVAPATFRGYRTSLEAWIQGAMGADIDHDGITALFADTLREVEGRWSRTA